MHVLHRQCAVHNESHEGIYYGLHTNDWPPLVLQTLQKIRELTRILHIQPICPQCHAGQHIEPTAPATECTYRHITHFYVVRPVINLHSYGVRCKNNSQLSTTVFIQCYGSHSLGNAISMPYKCSLHTKQGHRLPRCQQKEEKKKR